MTGPFLGADDQTHAGTVVGKTLLSSGSINSNLMQQRLPKQVSDLIGDTEWQINQFLYAKDNVTNNFLT
jgi:hypothetical protein